MTIKLLNTEAQSAVYKVTGEHFGVNVVTVYDTEFADSGSPLIDFVASMSITNLRFPGGSATERDFDMTNPNAEWSRRDPTEQLTPMDDFFAAAGRSGFDVTLVLPTTIGFSKSAANAMLDGTYGSRSELTDSYIDDILLYIDTALDYAESNGVQITAFEIGNEFWGGGMTASEYGHIAGRVAKAVQDHIEKGSQGDIPILAQTTSSASDIFSPQNNTNVFIDTEGEVFSQSQIDKHFGGNTPLGWQEVIVLGQGSARSQVTQIADGINATEGAALALDGIVQHAYFGMGLDKVDNSKEFMFGQWSSLEEQLDRPSNAPKMLKFLTEWNTDSRGALDNRGLEHASMIIETFHEIIQNGITNSHMWPLTFNNAQGISLVDLKDGHLAIAGEMYKLMAESLPGTEATIDLEVSGQIDIHGFESESRDVLFVSERSGQNLDDVNINIETLTDNPSVFITVTELWDGGAGGANAHAVPIVTYGNGYLSQNDEIAFNLNAYANTRIEVTEIGNGADRVLSYGGNDNVKTYGGRDTVITREGNDTVHSGWDHDMVFCGTGDDMLIGGRGNDFLSGGEGRDLFVFSNSDGYDTVSDFHFGEDSLRINGEIFASIEDLLAGQTVTVAFNESSMKILYGTEDAILLENYSVGEDPAISEENDTVIGSIDSDIMVGNGGGDIFSGQQGDDKIFGLAGDDLLVGGQGFDEIWAGSGNDTVRGGDDADHLHGESGDDLFIAGSGDDFVTGGSGYNRLFGQWGDDTLHGGNDGDRLNGGGGSDWLVGNDGNDWIRAGNSEDYLSGGQGNDTLIANSENDRVEGGAGNDRIFGGGGDDFIIAGEGNDYVKGGAGADVFVFGSGMDRDYMVGFNPSEDVLRINSNLLNEEDDGWEVVQNYSQNTGTHIVLDFGSGDVIIFAYSQSLEGFAESIEIF